VNRRSVLKGMGFLAGAAVIAPVVSSVSVVAIDAVQSKRNAQFAAANFPPSPSGSEVLVAYYSRSGNTELMALELARAMHATTLPLRDESYPIGFRGWINALRDARRTEAAVQSPVVDLSSYETVFIGAPIWLYNPAPPAWEFVRRSDLTGKRVVLFNSMNSKFEQRYIDQFADLVRQQGGFFVAHLYVIRGRMTQQLATADFLAEVRQRLTML
jgi:flavodoxin